MALRLSTMMHVATVARPCSLLPHRAALRTFTSTPTRFTAEFSLAHLRAAVRSAAGAGAVRGFSVARKGAWPSLVGEDRLLFVCERDNFFRLLTATCISQAVFWLFVASFAVDLREDIKDGEESKAPTERPPANIALRAGMTAVSLGIASAFVAMGFIFPSRFIHTFTVLKGGATARVGTYTFFGRRVFEVPLDQMTFTSLNSLLYSSTATARIQGHRWHPLRCCIRGSLSRWYFLLDGRQGKVVDMELFSAFARRVKSV